MFLIQDHKIQAYVRTIALAPKNKLQFSHWNLGFPLFPWVVIEASGEMHCEKD